MPICQIIVGIEIEIEIDPCPPWHPAFTERSNFTVELCQHRINTVAVPGFSCPNPITRPFDTDPDSDPDPELASPWTFSDSHELGPETYTYTAKRYTFTYTMMGRVRVRGSADLSDHCRNRNRDRNRNRSLPFMAPGLHGPLRLDCRVVSAPQYPVSHVRIPSPVPSIPIPIATPTPSLLRHGPFRIATSSAQKRTRTQRSGTRSRTR
ncbi:MAG: hypothetical protein ACOX52_00400 [Verrucomicrobiota bacterium]